MFGDNVFSVTDIGVVVPTFLADVHPVEIAAAFVQRRLTAGLQPFFHASYPLFILRHILDGTGFCRFHGRIPVLLDLGELFLLLLFVIRRSVFHLYARFAGRFFLTFSLFGAYISCRGYV